MNFYFCESCGKRITDKAIEAGKGKNKNLKGVYCTRCAVGVSTMNSLPLTDEMAKEILSSAKPVARSTPGARSTPTGVPTHRGRRTSGIRIPAATSRGKRTSASSNKLTPENLKADGSNKWPLIGGVVSACILLGLVVWYMSTAPGDSPKKVRKPVKERTAPEAKPLAKPAAIAEVKPELPLQTSNPSNSETRANAEVLQAAYARLVTQWGGMAEDAWLLKIEIAKTFLAAHGDSSFAGSVRERITGWQEQLDKTRRQPTVLENEPASTDKTVISIDKPTTEPVKAQSKPVKSILYRKVFYKHLEGILDALHDANVDGALVVSEKKWDEAAFGDWLPAAQELPHVLGVLKIWRQERQKGLSKLVGSMRNLRTKKGVRKGRITKVEGEVLTLQPEYTINGKLKQGAAFKVPLSDLTPKAITRLCPVPKPDSPQEWIALALTFFVQENSERGEQALSHGKGHALEEPFRHFLLKLKGDLQESKAKVLWEALVSRAKGTLSESQVNKLLEAFAQFNTTYGTTVFAKAQKLVAVRLMSDLEKRTRRSKHLLDDNFRCQIGRYDIKSGQASFFWDFSHPTQLRDFALQKTGIASVIKGKLIVNDATALDYAISTARHELVSIDVSQKCSLKARGGITVNFGLRNSCQVLITDKEVILQQMRTEAFSKYGRIMDWEIVAKAEFVRSANFLLSIRKRGRSFVVLAGKKEILKGDCPMDAEGNLLSWGYTSSEVGIGFEIDELTISAKPASGWIDETLMMQNLMRKKKGVTLTWTNATGDGKWSTGSNWHPPHVPGEKDAVVFSHSVSANCLVETNTLTGSLRSFVMQAGYSGVVTFAPGFGKSQTQTLNLTGPFVCMGGTVVFNAKVSGKGTSAEGIGVTVVARDFLLGATGLVDGLGKGFPAQSGPGYVAGSGHKSALITGASHGWYSAAQHAAPYGDPKAPLSLGSGGGHGTGGGAIKVSCPDGHILINGRLAFGAPYCLARDGGAGSGGSIYLVAKTISGSPDASLEVYGGSVGNQGGGHGGSGGRIALVCEQFKFKGRYNAEGGKYYDKKGVHGFPGTVFLPKGIALKVESEFALPPGEHTFSSVVVTSKGRLFCQSNSDPDGNPSTHDGKGCTLIVSRLTVHAGGLISAKQLGYPRKMGPGAGTGFKGGVHRVVLANGSKKSNVTSEAFLKPGSGGGRGFGGGAVIIRCPSGEVKVDGTIQVNGGRGGRSVGAGSGGSIFIECHNISGGANGMLQANGGSTSGAGGKGGYGGSGGSIVILASTFENSGQMECLGGSQDGVKVGKDGLILKKKR